MKAYLLILLIAAGTWPVPVCSRSLSMLAEPPEWSHLDRYQNTMTRSEFEQRMERYYAPSAPWRKWIAVSDEGASVVMADEEPQYRYFIAFAVEPKSEDAELNFELNGLHIAIDPGHIGGSFADMEQRSFQIGEDLPVREGDLVLDVAQRLKAELEARGARVTLIRSRPEPVTDARPEEFRADAEAMVRERLEGLEPGDPEWERRVGEWQNLLFYRVSEILARSERVNREIQPDLVLALHMNAESWPREPPPYQLVPNHHFHLLINGAYMESELALDDVRFAMIRKLLSREIETELLLAEPLINAFLERTPFPAYEYEGNNAVPITGQPYLYGRNLMANRLYRAPVLYFEPYVANSEIDYPRIQLYLKAKEEGTTLESSLIGDYVDAVLLGLESAAAGFEELGE